MPGNYRGVHLTAILSKTAERLIGQRLVLHLQKCAFGNYQWAFTPKLSSRDLVTALVMSWILSICTNKKIAAYLSDITGAFDRMSKDYLMAKLYFSGHIAHSISGVTITRWENAKAHLNAYVHYLQFQCQRRHVKELCQSGTSFVHQCLAIFVNSF